MHLRTRHLILASIVLVAVAAFAGVAAADTDANEQQTASDNPGCQLGIVYEGPLEKIVQPTINRAKDTYCATDPGDPDPGTDVCVNNGGEETCALETVRPIVKSGINTAGEKVVKVFTKYDNEGNGALRDAEDQVGTLCVRVKGYAQVCFTDVSDPVISTSEYTACEGKSTGEEVQEDERPRDCDKP